MENSTPIPRVIGVDYGQKRVGVAVSDLTGTLAGQAQTLTVRGMADAAAQVAAFAANFGAAVAVVGNPLNMDGSAGPAAQACAVFADMLRDAAPGLEVVMLDERLSTSLAHVYMNAADVTGKKRKQNVDAAAACIILQDWLDRRRC